MRLSSSDLMSPSLTTSTSHAGDPWQRQMILLGEALENGDMEAAQEAFDTISRHQLAPSPSLFTPLGLYETGKVSSRSSRTLTMRV